MGTKSTLLVALLSLLATLPSAAYAESENINQNRIVNIQQIELGSGTPGTTGLRVAKAWDIVNNIYHAPQYMPGYPTAATIYPRVLDIECVEIAVVTDCVGYNWMPEYGRGEYLMFRPYIVHPAETIRKEIKEVEVPVVILKEVPVKKGKE